MGENVVKTINNTYYNGDKLYFNYYIVKSPQDIMTLHTHDVIEIILFYHGDVSYIVEGRQYKIKDNDIFIVAPTVYHRVKIDSPADYERLDILIEKSLFPENLVERLFSDDRLIIRSATAELKNIFDRLLYYCKNFKKDEIDDFTVLLMTELFYNILYTNKANASPVVTNVIVQNAIDYIDRNIATIKSPNEICEALDVSKSNLYRVFVGEFGITPMDYIRDKRLSNARRELHNGKRATDVFTECGFSCYTTFYRAYIDTYGYPPSEEAERSYPDYIIRS